MDHRAVLLEEDPTEQAIDQAVIDRAVKLDDTRRKNQAVLIANELGRLFRRMRM